MKITICGSVRFIKEMQKAKETLKGKGHEVLMPMSAEINQPKEYWDTLKSADIKKFVSLKRWGMKGHFDKVKAADAILVLNYDKDGKKSYIGPNTLMEIAIAFEHAKKIFVLNPLPNDSHYEELISMSPICLNGNLDNLG